jgi:hypothetical protein
MRFRKNRLANFTRKGLIEGMDRLLDALVSHDPARAAIAPATRYTENGQALAVGDGLWGTADAFGPYRHDFIDSSVGAAVSFVTVREGDKHAILAARLRLEGDALAEIETIVVRPGLMGSVTAYADGPQRLDAARGPDPAWLAPIATDERSSRAELQRIANCYFSAIERNDGKGEYPFAEDCVRIEHGYHTAREPDAVRAGLERDPDTPYAPEFKALGVKQQLETGFFRFVTAIRDRRFVAIDPELGVAVGFAFFDHAGTVRDYRLADGTPARAGLSQPFTWQIAEAFRIERGLITRIEAVLNPCPYGMKPNW